MQLHYLKNVIFVSLFSSPVCVLEFFSFKVKVKVLHVGKGVLAVRVSVLPWVCVGGNNPVKGNFKLMKPSHFNGHF